jgi:hypothetical protein
MGNVEGSGVHSNNVRRDINSAIKEFYENMNPTNRNIFVLDELIKERNKYYTTTSYIKDIGKSTSYFFDYAKKVGQIYGSLYGDESQGTVTNNYNYLSGEKSHFHQKMQERLFAARHPIAAWDIGLFEKGATNITTNSIRFSTQGISAINPLGVLDSSRTEGSQVNAFRHTLWQSAISAKYGENIATKVGDAHETYRTLDLGVRQFKTLNEADQTIDLLNNIIGRRIGSENKNTSMKVQAQRVLDQFHKDGLYVAKDNPSGVEVVKERITDEQHSYMSRVFERGDNNGFSPDQLLERGKNKK